MVICILMREKETQTCTCSQILKMPAFSFHFRSSTSTGRAISFHVSKENSFIFYFSHLPRVAYWALSRPRGLLRTGCGKQRDQRPDTVRGCHMNRA